MSIKNDKKVVPVSSVPVAQAAPVFSAPEVSGPRLGEIDKMALELAKSRRQTALAEAKTALAQNENAELAYKYVVLQLYMKYGLTERDAISENGDIIKEGAVQSQ
jgi:hypothetical protein